jgi:uncharacterized damage-inducible protein DinB
MIAQLKKYVHYNKWANQLIAKQTETLTQEQIHTEIVGSFNSVYKTILHIWDAESIWLQRLNMAETILVPSTNQPSNWRQIIESWLQTSDLLLEKIAEFKDNNNMTHQVVYLDSKRIPHKSEVQDIFMHVCNHSTYHRGQITNFLRQLGITKLSSTDFITYSRLKLKMIE